MGVDIFFVISGFVISLSAVRLHYNWRTFLANRLCRIVPFYWLMSVPLTAQLIHHHLMEWRTAANTFLFIPWFDFGYFHRPIHGFGWTLSFEFWFYTLFAALLAMLGSRALAAIAPLLAFLCILTYIGYSGAWYTPHFLFNPFTLEFAAGVLLYRVKRFGGLWSLAIAVSMAAFLGWETLKTESLGAHLHILVNPQLGFERSLIWGGFGVALLTIAVSIDNLQLLTWPRWLVRLGDCSYSIYLMQPFALIVARFCGNHSPAPIIVSGVVYVSCVFVGGSAVSKCIEMPLTRWAKRKFAPRPLANGASPHAVTAVVS